MVGRTGDASPVPPAVATPLATPLPMAFRRTDVVPIHIHCLGDVEPTVLFLPCAATKLLFQLGVACYQQLSCFVSPDS